MNDDGYDNVFKDPSVLLLWFIIACIIALSYFFGWIVPVVLVILVGLFSLFVYFYEKNHPPIKPYHVSNGENIYSELLDTKGHCKKCGSTLFYVEPDITTAQEIIDFARLADGWKDNPDALAGWMPPGVYCPKGCFDIHTTPIPKVKPDVGNSAIASKLGTFEDLLTLASKVGKSDDIYKKQNSFIAYYRKGKRRFLATMLIRKHFTCTVCNKQIGEAELHYEDPVQPIIDNSDQVTWGEPVGSYCDIRLSQLHGIMEHGDTASKELKSLCDGIKD